MQQIIRTNSDIVSDYVAVAPLALAFERVMECRILAEQRFERPVLDIGCGEGLFAKVLFADPIDTGIDPNPRELSRARELGAYVELIECRGDAVPKPDSSYRTILSNSVIEHIPDIQPVLREAFRLLVPGGRLYLTVPSNHFDEYTWISQLLAVLGLKTLRRQFGAFFNRFWAHYHYYTPARWSEIMAEAGFEVLEVRGYGPRRACLMNDLLVPFSVPEYFTKKFCNRWTLFPGLRRIILAPLSYLGALVLRDAENCETGGLVFLSLRKPG
jgi:ubiquinone/menaquinone biosynthesis C-methylase UbiE